MKYFIIYADSGHGHRRVAEYLAQELSQRRLAGQMRCLNLLDYTSSRCKSWYPALYRWLVTCARPLWKIIFHLGNSRLLYGFSQRCRSIYNGLRARDFIKFLLKEQPDVIVTTHFFPAELCATLKRQGKVKSVVISLVTDFITHAIWVNPGIDYYLVMADQTKKGLLSWGVPGERIKVQGIPVSSKFGPSGQQGLYRKKHGVNAEMFTVLIMGGGFGIGRIHKLVDTFNRYFFDSVQLVVVCGKNHELEKALRASSYRIRIKCFGYVDIIDELMEASDIVITKGGALTICESLAKGRPIIIFDPIPGQEAYNTSFLLDRKAALYLKRTGQIKEIMENIFNHPNLLSGLKENGALINKATAASEIADFMLAFSRQ